MGMGENNLPSYRENPIYRPLLFLLNLLIIICVVFLVLYFLWLYLSITQSLGFKDTGGMGGAVFLLLTPFICFGVAIIIAFLSWFKDLLIKSKQKQTMVSSTPTPSSFVEENNLNTKVASFGRRAVAILLDLILLSLLSRVINLFSKPYLETQPVVYSLISLGDYMVFLSYWVLLTGFCGQTLGKKLMHIKVVQIDGSPVSFKNAFLREIPGKFISLIPTGFGFLSAALDTQKRTWHDKIAKTIVVNV